MTVMRMSFFALNAILLLFPQNATRVNSRLVDVSVVVRDKNGPMSGLNKDDFIVTDNGRTQRIDHFSVSDPRNQKQTSIGAIPGGVASNIRNAAGEVRQGATAILFDMMNASNESQSSDVLPLDNAANNLKAGDQKEAIRQLVGYLRTIREDDRVALFVLGYQVHPIQDFTGDPHVLL